MAGPRQVDAHRPRRRASKIARLAGSEAAKSGTTKVANLTRDHDGRRAAAERRQIKAAEQIVEVLGQMKGAAMKVGQVASFLDSGVAAPGGDRADSGRLAELRDSAPVVSFKEMKQGDRADLGRAHGKVFATSTRTRSQLPRSGRSTRDRPTTVAAWRSRSSTPALPQAVRADLQNLGMILQIAKRVAPGIDIEGVSGEIRERITEELDYEHEAQNQRAFARAWRDHPFVMVPDVMTDYCGEHVLVCEFVEGIGFEEVQELDQAARDRYGEIVFRFFFGSRLPQRPLLGRSPSRQLPADGRRARGVPRLRDDQRLDRAEVDQEADRRYRRDRGRRRGLSRQPRRRSATSRQDEERVTRRSA